MKDLVDRDRALPLDKKNLFNKKSEMSFEIMQKTF